MPSHLFRVDSHLFRVDSGYYEQLSSFFCRTKTMPLPRKLFHKQRSNSMHRSSIKYMLGLVCCDFSLGAATSNRRLCSRSDNISVDLRTHIRHNRHLSTKPTGQCMTMDN